MQLGKHQQSLKGSEVAAHRAATSNLVLAIVVLILAIVNFRKDHTVTLEPPKGYGKSVEISEKKASENFHASWAEYVAVLLGNVTPDNAAHLADALRPILSPELYQDVTKQIAAEAERLKLEQISTRFLPSAVRFDPETQKTYVTGEHVTQGLRGTQEHEVRTYEFEFAVVDHAPSLKFMTFYNGLPKLASK